MIPPTQQWPSSTSSQGKNLFPNYLLKFLKQLAHPEFQSKFGSIEFTILEYILEFYRILVSDSSCIWPPPETSPASTKYRGATRGNDVRFCRKMVELISNSQLPWQHGEMTHHGIPWPCLGTNKERVEVESSKKFSNMDIHSPLPNVNTLLHQYHQISLVSFSPNVPNPSNQPLSLSARWPPDTAEKKQSKTLCFRMCSHLLALSDSNDDYMIWEWY